MNRTLYILPIEPLEERYTGEWYKHLPKHFESVGFDVVTIDGTPTTTSVETGTFLDINSTIHYKAGQMQAVSELFRHKQVKNNDVFFVSDLEFWGIESLRMLAQINQVEIKIFGFLHAASYTIEDAFAVAAPYQKYTELGWLKAVDGVFVGSDYHKQAIIDRRIKPFAAEADIKEMTQKIIVSGNPLFMDAYDISDRPWKKENKIVITNRFDIEKRPDQSLLTALLVKEQMPDVEIVVTTSRPQFKSNAKWLVDLARMYEKQGLITIKEGLSKEEYHAELKSARVMLTNSIEENFGYCIVEAIMFGTVPIMPRGLSHTELAWGDQRFLFDSIDGAVTSTLKALNGEFEINAEAMLSRYLRAADFMAVVMRDTE